MDEIALVERGRARARFLCRQAANACDDVGWAAASDFCGVGVENEIRRFQPCVMGKGTTAQMIYGQRAEEMGDLAGQRPECERAQVVGLFLLRETCLGQVVVVVDWRSNNEDQLIITERR